MGTELALILGAQTAAAHTVDETAKDFVSLLQKFGEGLEDDVDPLAFSAIAAFGDGLKSWFEAAKPVGEGLKNYAEALASVDSTTAATEEKVARRFSSVPSAAYSAMATLMGGEQ